MRWSFQLDAVRFRSFSELKNGSFSLRTRIVLTFFIPLLLPQCFREPPSTRGTSFYVHTKSLEIIQHSKQLWTVENRCSFDTGWISRTSWPQTGALQVSPGKFLVNYFQLEKCLLVQPRLTSFFLACRWRLIVASSIFNELHLFFSDTGAGTSVEKKFTAFMTEGDTCSLCILWVNGYGKICTLNTGHLDTRHGKER